MIELSTQNCLNNDVLEDVCGNVYADVTIYFRDNVLNNVRANVRINVWKNVFEDLCNHTKLK